MKTFSSNEFRRKYMCDLISGICSLYDVDRKEAKKALSLVLGLIEEKARRGEEINLGCFKIKPTTSPPRVVNSVLTGQRHYRGETKKWVVIWSRKWMHTAEPVWSRFA